MTRLLAVLLAVFIATPSYSQFVSNGNNGGGSTGASSGPGIQDQAENVTDTFSGLTFKVQRLVKDPGTPNAYRLIMRVTETEETGRRVAMVQPTATLVDEMGNLYYVGASSGVPICTQANKSWSLDTKNCAYYTPNTPVTLTPSQPTPVVLMLLPWEERFSSELAELAQTASLTARFAIYSTDLKQQTFYDVIINGITLPQGGS